MQGYFLGKAVMKNRIYHEEYLYSGIRACWEWREE